MRKYILLCLCLVGVQFLWVPLEMRIPHQEIHAALSESSRRSATLDDPASWNVVRRFSSESPFYDTKIPEFDLNFNSYSIRNNTSRALHSQIPASSAIVGATFPMKSVHSLQSVYYLNVPGENGIKRHERIQRIFKQTLPEVKLTRFMTVPVNDSRIQKDQAMVDKQVQSNLLSHTDAWKTFATDQSTQNNSWAVFLEDDSVFHPSYHNKTDLVRRAVQNLFELGKGDGFVYLGICPYPPVKPDWSEGMCAPNHVKTSVHDGIFFAKGCGVCAHAYALTKWKAGRFWSEISIRKYSSDYSLCNPPGQKKQHVHRLSNPSQRNYLDVHLYCWTMESRPFNGVWIAGANLSHSGIMYQDRSIGQSIFYPK